MNSPVEEIKTRLDIVDLIQSYIKLTKAGINYKANCPFHGEKTPSFFVSPTRQMWHCFGCGRGGDIFKFIMEIEGHDFPEALKALAARAGVEVRREDPRVKSQKNRLYEICEEAAKVFEKSFAATPVVQAYMKKRGVSPETLKEFRVGFAPQSWDFLLRALSAQGFKKEEIAAAGLAIQSEDRRSWYDRFRSRIMFPITDASGQVIGFGGRVFASPSEALAKEGTGKTIGDAAKYINTPATLIYDKSRVLYGFHRAKQEIRSKNQAVMVEGYMDCIMSYQAGVKNTIAVSGTALTTEQLKVVKRLCNTIVSSFDTDSAGESATKRSLALASEMEFECRVASIPSGKDPADAVLESPQHWIEAIASAKPVIEFYFTRAFARHSPETVQGKKAISDMVLPWVSKLANEIEKVHWVKKIADGLGVSEESVFKELKKEKEEPARHVSQPVVLSRVPTRRELLEERLLLLLPFIQEEVRAEKLPGHYIAFSTTASQNLFDVFSAASGPVVAVPELARELEMLKFKGELLLQSVQDPHAELKLCITELERECIKDRLVAIGREVEKQEKAGNNAAVETLLQEFKALSAKLK